MDKKEIKITRLTNIQLIIQHLFSPHIRNKAFRVAISSMMQHLHRRKIFSVTTSSMLHPLQCHNIFSVAPSSVSQHLQCCTIFSVVPSSVSYHLQFRNIFNVARSSVSQHLQCCNLHLERGTLPSWRCSCGINGLTGLPLRRWAMAAPSLMTCSWTLA